MAGHRLRDQPDDVDPLRRVLPVRLARRAAQRPAGVVPHAAALAAGGALGAGGDRKRHLRAGLQVPAAGRRPCHCRDRAADRDRARRAVPGRARRPGALAGRRRGLCRRAADRASRLQDVRLAAAAAAGRRRACGPAIRSSMRLCSRAGLGRNDPGLVGVRRLRRDHAGRTVPVAMAGRLQRHAAGRDRAAGRAGALRADQGARPCRGERRAALQLHPAGLGHDPGRPRVRRHSRPLDARGRGHRRGQRALHLAPRPADGPKTRYG